MRPSSIPHSAYNMEVEEATEINPADYFNPDRPGPNPGVLRKAWYPTLFTGVGIGLACFVNAFNKKPVFSGKHRESVHLDGLFCSCYFSYFCSH